MLKIGKPESPHTLTLSWVEQATTGFVFCDAMREAVSLALVAGLNLIFSGPGGHAKSEFLETVFRAINGQEPYIKSFGRDTSTEELFGGIDFDALNRSVGATLQYKPAFSFLESMLAIFEELFDAPPRVLTGLKDTLTARELRNGHQRHPMKTRVIAAATNHSPQEIAELGPEIEALVQRFPIQLEVRWPHYEKSAFTDLFTAVLDREGVASCTTWVEVEALQQQANSVIVSAAVRSLMAQILVELTKDRVSISPRTAIVALQLARAAAVINGRNQVIPADLRAVQYLPGAHHLGERIRELIIELATSVEAEEKLSQAQCDLTELTTRFNDTTDEDELRAISDAATSLAQRIGSVRVSPDQAKWKTEMHNSALSLANEAKDVKCLIELKSLETMLSELRCRFDANNTLNEWQQFCADVNALNARTINLPVHGGHATKRVECLLGEIGSLLQRAEAEQQRIRLEAGAGVIAQRLSEIGKRVAWLSGRLSKPCNPQERRKLLDEVNRLEAELGQMVRDRLVHPVTQPEYDAIMSKIMIIRSNVRTH